MVAACTGGGSPSLSPTDTLRGGTLRTAVVIRWSPSFDPQKAYDAVAWELFRCCLLRTLMSYNGHPTNEGGAEVQLDLAAAPPDISDDQMTWTFRLKRGIQYGPPLEDVEVTAPDIVRALEREADPTITPEPCPPGQACGYPWLFSVIQGFDAFRAGRAQSISGLLAPDDYTLRVNLTRPTGDLGYRLALPATAPIPPGSADLVARYGVAEGQTDYGGFLVATGPYMYEGSSALDFTSPVADEKPVAGYVPARTTETGAFHGKIVLVRNPAWRRGTDSLRAAHAGRIEVSLGGYDITDYPLNQFLQRYPAEMKSLFREVAQGRLDLVLDTSPSIVQLRNLRSDQRFEGQIRINDISWVDYIQLNLAVPPLDDLHVRKAVNLAIDRPTLRNRWLRGVSGKPIPEAAGGAKIATHLAPDALENNELLSYRPIWMTSSTGFDLPAARREMALSGYDANGDGICDAEVCEHVSMIETDIWPTPFDELVREDLAKIGIDVEIRRYPTDIYYGEHGPGEPDKRVAMNANSWSNDYPNGSVFFPNIFYGPNLHSGSFRSVFDFSMLGALPRELRRWGYPVTSVPTVDERIRNCVRRTGSDQVMCWALLDEHLMEDVVPWVPFLFQQAYVLTSPRIAGYSFDQFALMPALDQIALTRAAIAADQS